MDRSSIVGASTHVDRTALGNFQPCSITTNSPPRPVVICDRHCQTWHSFRSRTSSPYLSVAMQGLNVGGGGGRSSEIKIRLIEFCSKDQYLPYEAIIGTMLHELCHNEVGPHNAHFYQLLDKITLVGLHICPCSFMSVTPTSICASHLEMLVCYCVSFAS